MKYENGNIVTVREELEPARIVNRFDDSEEHEPWYEIEAINLKNVPHREVMESDLRPATRIAERDGIYRYFDSNWKEIHAGDTIKHPSGETQKVYRTTQGLLGTDATNPKWIESGRANPCEYGIYPLCHEDVTYCVVEE